MCGTYIDVSAGNGLGPAPNFISDVFYLTLAMNHIGYQKTIGTFDETLRHYDELERHLEMVNGDGSWRNVSPMDSPSSCSSHC